MTGEKSVLPVSNPPPIRLRSARQAEASVRQFSAAQGDCHGPATNGLSPHFLVSPAMHGFVPDVLPRFEISDHPAFLAGGAND
jgi:hypothetical protein